MPQGSEVQVSHKTSNKYLKNIQKSITELLHLAATTTRRIIVPHVTYNILDRFGLSKFKGGGAICPLAPLIKILSLLAVRSPGLVISRILVAKDPVSSRMDVCPLSQSSSTPSRPTGVH